MQEGGCFAPGRLDSCQGRGIVGGQLTPSDWLEEERMDLIYRYDPFAPLKWHPPTDADEALRLLHDGHQRFVDFVGRMRQHVLDDSATETMVVPVDPVSLGLPLWHASAPTQMPFALVLGCSDARVPVERVFDQAFNNLFVVRIAGNVLGTECLGSFDFAVRRLAESLKLVVVLGHTSCGAVTAAVDMYLDPRHYPEIACTHALRSLVDRIMIAVRGAAKALERAYGPGAKKHLNYRAALIDTAVYLNSAFTAFDLRRETNAVSLSTAQTVFGVYDLDTLSVRGVPDAIAAHRRCRRLDAVAGAGNGRVFRPADGLHCRSGGQETSGLSAIRPTTEHVMGWHGFWEYLIFAGLIGVLFHAATGRFAIGAFSAAAASSVLNAIHEAWVADWQVNPGWLLPTLLVGALVALPVCAIAGLPVLVIRRWRERRGKSEDAPRPSG